MAQRKKAAPTQAAPPLQEVHSLREPARAGYCCGKPMRKFAAPSPSTGGVNQVMTCETCGKQDRIQRVH